MSLLKPKSCCFYVSLETGSFLITAYGFLSNLSLMGYGIHYSILSLILIGAIRCAMYAIGHYGVFKRNTAIISLLVYAMIANAIISTVIMLWLITIIVYATFNGQILAALLRTILLPSMILDLHFLAVIYGYYSTLKERETADRIQIRMP